jgi:predicted NAD/FAD-dependent oxidoreductase
MKKIAIIGAGLAGLSAAHFLKDKADITIIEKSRGVSGRLSTRRAEPYFFDHGAQYFSARTEAFQAFIEPLKEAGVIQTWNPRLAEIKDREVFFQDKRKDDDPHYVGVPGMNAIGKYLSRDMNVMLGVRVSKILKDGDGWILMDDAGDEIGRFDWVISAVPAAQALDILPASFNHRQRIESISMQGCFALMLGFDQPLDLDFDAARVHGEDISWIANNGSKPEREGAYSLLVHSSNGWADAHMDDEREQVTEYLCGLTSELIGHNISRAAHQALHGWRYANVASHDGQTYFLDKENCLALCGDWCIEGRVEAAFTSAYNLSQKIARAFVND